MRALSHKAYTSPGTLLLPRTGNYIHLYHADVWYALDFIKRYITLAALLVLWGRVSAHAGGDSSAGRVPGGEDDNDLRGGHK